MPLYKIGATHNHVQLGLPDKGRAIKGFVVCSSLDLLNGLNEQGCKQPSPEL